MSHWKGRVFFSKVGAERTIARKVSTSLLMILQEAVGNAFQHGHASSVTVELEYGEKSLFMRVMNAGETFDVNKVEEKGHYGLAGMRTRAQEIGGTLKIESGDEITEITVEVPYG